MTLRLEDFILLIKQKGYEVVKAETEIKHGLPTGFISLKIHPAGEENNVKIL
jgi:hypothetical protein